MTLNTSHVPGDAGHVADHNAIATQVNQNATDIAARETSAHAAATYETQAHASGTYEAVVMPEAFGAVGDGVTDDSTAIQNAINSLTRGGRVIFGAKKYKVGSTITIPQGVGLVGRTVAPGFDAGTANFDPTTVGTVILLASTASFSMLYNTALEGFTFLLSTWSKPANQTAATALVASFAGKAIQVNGSDVRIANCGILGFQYAIYQNGETAPYERVSIEQVWFDCTNGIRIGPSSDLGYIRFCRGFPFLTAQQGWTAVTNHRSGFAFSSGPNHDWATYAHCNSYGFNQGFVVNGSNNVMLTDCSADSTEQDNTSVGLYLTGSVSGATIRGFRASGHYYGIQVASSGSVKIEGSQAWGSARHVYITGTSSVDINNNFWWYLADGVAPHYAAIHPVEVAATASGIIACRGNTFLDSGSTYPGTTAYTVDASRLANFSSGVEDRFLNGVTAGVTRSAAHPWTAYTPTLGGTGWALGNGTTDCRYQIVGRSMVVKGTITFGTTTTFGTGTLEIALPVAGNSGEINTTPLGVLVCNQGGTFCYGSLDMATSQNSLVCRVWSASGAYASLANVTSTAPFTWASGGGIQFQAVVELG